MSLSLRFLLASTKSTRKLTSYHRRRTSAYDLANNRTSLAATIAGVDDFLNSSTFNALNQLTNCPEITSLFSGTAQTVRCLDTGGLAPFR